MVGLARRCAPAIVAGRVLLVAAAALGPPLADPTSSWAQSRRPTGDEWNQVRPLFALVEGVAVGAPAPADVDLSWHCDFFNADAGVVLVPFTLDIRRGSFTSFPLAMYVRVVLRGAPAPRPGPKDALAQYPFEDAAIVEGPIAGRLSRAFTAPPGSYDVYVAITERSIANAAPPKTVVTKQEVTIPDLKSGLTTSSVIVAEQIETDATGRRATYEQQLDEPYRLWGIRITPATRRVFKPSETLSLLFLVYQAKAAGSDKPDVGVAYSIHRSAPGIGDSVIASIRPELFNGSTLPPTFSLSGGDLILAGRQIPLDRLSPGPYRLEIAVTDHVAQATVRRVVPFSIDDPVPH